MQHCSFPNGPVGPLAALIILSACGCFFHRMCLGVAFTVWLVDGVIAGASIYCGFDDFPYDSQGWLT